MAKRNVRFTVRSETWAGSRIGGGRRRSASSGKATSVGMETQLEPDEIIRGAAAVFSKADAKLREFFGWDPSVAATPPDAAEPAATPTPTQESQPSEDSPEPPAGQPPKPPSAPASLQGSVPALAISFAPPVPPAPREGLFDTQFGGQPDWLEAPAWPRSTQDGEAMEFVGQFALHPEDLPWLTGPKMAYLFVTIDEYDPGGYATWDPFAGENALIVQPGVLPDWVATEPRATGPSVWPDAAVVGLEHRLDPPVASIAELALLSEDDRDRWHGLVDYDKVGGTPNFFQDLEFPDFASRSVTREPDAATPVFMLRSAEKAGLSLGDAGRGVGFLSPDQRSGAYLWFN